MSEMPIVGDDQARAGSKSAFDQQIVLGVVQERPKPESGLDQDRHGAQCLKNDIDFLQRYMRAGQAGSFEDIFLFQKDGRR